MHEIVSHSHSQRTTTRREHIITFAFAIRETFSISAALLSQKHTENIIIFANSTFEVLLSITNPITHCSVLINFSSSHCVSSFNALPFRHIHANIFRSSPTAPAAAPASVSVSERWMKGRIRRKAYALSFFPCSSFHQTRISFRI